MPDRQRKRDSRPNIIWIMSDDLAWADLGCYGQEKIRTPNIDALASRGIRFTSCYSGSTVCAPSRSSLMQGLHQGHATVRANMLAGYRHSLQDGDQTVAEVLRSAGYVTGLFGKWGLATCDQPGLPRRKGFDEFFGYLNQRHAHNYYPTHLWQNEQKVPFSQHEGFRPGEMSEYDDEGSVRPAGMADPSRAQYSFDVCAEHSRRFVREHADEPFLLYLAYTPPHGKLIVPSIEPYTHLDWPHVLHKVWAAMITRMDAEVGRLVELLKELGVYENTLIFFCSDNGYSPFGAIPRAQRERGVPTLDDFFHHRGPFRGGKGDLREGGLRVPMIAHWPAAIGEPSQCDLPWAFWDFLPTAAELAGADVPDHTDGVSIAPTLRGEPGRQQDREFLYWEFLGAHGVEQAVRMGDWRAYRANADSPTELYDISADAMEERNLAGEHPDQVARAEELFAREHTPSAYFPSPGESVEQWKARVEAEGTHLAQNVDLF